ncbi:putative galactinol--sucrose galactosyltransferase 2 [Vitis vinifera]|uniref:galactinol--sucrose galactosyltransferase n=1 Tax=Vitis vinifera TaxID=29760 RepID=A0A438GSE0_VITVI|nr:putative galactinol--sucrose galactosyltransferase 2 [Vitis vinifera]
MGVFVDQRKWCGIGGGGAKMTITAKPSITDGGLMVGGRVVCNRVAENLVVSPESSGSAFLGATSPAPRSRHVFNVGVLEGYRFICLFRAKFWWMIPRVGKSASEIPMETQMLLLEVREESALDDENSSDMTSESTFYVLFLPVLDGPFRTSLQGTSENVLQFCVESGDNPFELLKNSIKILEKRKGTFAHIEHKKAPPHLDWFGWCTWDAFYTEVNPQGIREGLQSFLEGGCPPKFLIIDDGWQETINEFHKGSKLHIDGTQLVDIRENSKFKSSGSESSCIDLHDFIQTIKERYRLKFVYMWHAIIGYWGGVLPSSKMMEKYNPKLAYPIQSPGNIGNLRDIAVDSLEKYGVGMIDPEKIFHFYNDLHGYLASSGVDGVKVDVQNILETIGKGYGGRVLLTRQYQFALDESIARNFKDNSLICCMSHNSDSIYSSRKSAVARASEDFMPKEPTFQTVHIASVAFNSLLLGEIVVPDWDTFHSNHSTAEFHGAARALGGCAVYAYIFTVSLWSSGMDTFSCCSSPFSTTVRKKAFHYFAGVCSDRPGTHDFRILKRLVLPDGSVLRAKYPGRPTRDCLFKDPVMDGESLLKIWNLNKLSGVVGVFNCQGAGNWPMKDAEAVPVLASTPTFLSGHVSPLDVEYLDQVAGDNWHGDSAVYAFYSERGYCTVLGQNLQFAPIGLLDMYNSGGAVEALELTNHPAGCRVKIRVRGCGRFGAYSSKKPLSCIVDMQEEEFQYNAEGGLLTVKLQGECSLREIKIVY